MLRMEIRRAGHDVIAQSYIGWGCRECTHIHCLTCDDHQYDLGGEGDVHEMIRRHINAR